MTLTTYVLLLGVSIASVELSTAQDCVILKRMGPADQITSHMYSFGIRGKQFQYVEGPLPKGIKFHGRLTDNDVRKIQSAGGRFVVLEPKFTGADLAEARKGCIANFTSASTASESQEVVGPSAAPQLASTTKPTAANQTAAGIPRGEDSGKSAPAPPAAVRQAQVQPAVITTVERADPLPTPSQQSAAQAAVVEGTASITSDPEGADIFVDSVGRGRTPIILKLPAGKHSIQLVLAAHKDWLQDVDLKAG